MWLQPLWSGRLLESENIGDQAAGLGVRDHQIRPLLVIRIPLKRKPWWTAIGDIQEARGAVLARFTDLVTSVRERPSPFDGRSRIGLKRPR
jgi:hypothetical protein